MKKIFNKLTLRYLVVTVFVVLIGIFAVTFFAKASSNPKTETADVQTVSSQILAQGTVAAQSQAFLNFQIGGKLTYLPFKEGDSIYQGQVVASLDTYALQKQLQIAANTYKSTTNNTNQTLENNQAGVVEGQQRVTLDTTSKMGYSSITENTLIYDNVKRIVDNANLAQNSAQMNVDLANYALSLGSITTPITGIILHEDVTTAGVNITPVTTFVIADPASKVFSANVRQQDINFISVGNSAKVMLDAQNGAVLQGVVDKIYPQKTTLASGEDTYRVDIKIDNLPVNAQFGQNGTVLIKSNFDQKVILVPSWTVLSNSYVWVLSDNKMIFKKVTVGDSFNGQTEILSGLSDTDKVITNPQGLISKLYQML
jgi:RND family efflux transporter MFP subunit